MPVTETGPDHLRRKIEKAPSLRNVAGLQSISRPNQDLERLVFCTI